MAINPNISLAVRGIDLPDPLAQYGKVMAIQGAQQQNQLAQMQMQEYERSRAEEEGLRNYLAQSDLAKPETRAGLARFGKPGLAYSTALSAQEKAALERQKLEGEIAAQPLAKSKAQSDLLDAKLKQSRGFLDTLDPSSPGAAEEYMRWHRANHADPVIGEALKARGVTVEQSMQRIQQLMQTPGGLARLINESKLGTEKFMEMNKPQLSTADLGGQVVTRTFAPLTGELKTIGTQAKTMAPGEAQRIKNEGERIGLEGRRVAVVEENARRDADPAFQQRMAGAKATGEAIAKGDVAAVQSLPKIIDRAEEGARLIDEMIGKRDAKTGQLLKGEKTHPGFENAVGATWLPGIRFAPGSDAVGFMSRFDQIKGASFLEAFESLKGGGAITEKEGAKGTDAINRMSISTDEKEFVRAAMDLQDIIRKGVANAQKRAAKAGVSAPAGSGALSDDPLGLRQ